MNYLAHGFRYTDRPDFLAGTALPDWLRVASSTLRIHPEQLPAPDDPRESEIRLGVLQHVADDRRFHDSPAFLEVSSSITTTIRHAFPHRRRMRSHFLGHILTELLLDACLLEDDGTRGARYYDAVDDVDGEHLADLVARWTGSRPQRLGHFVEVFRRERFLECYLDDARLLRRVSQVTRRVGLPDLPDGMIELVPTARQQVRGRWRELLQAG